MKKSIILTMLASAVTLGAFAQSSRKAAPAATPTAQAAETSAPTVRGGRDVKRVAHPTGKGEGVIPYGATAPVAAKHAAAPARAQQEKATSHTGSQVRESKHMPMAR